MHKCDKTSLTQGLMFSNENISPLDYSFPMKPHCILLDINNIQQRITASHANRKATQIAQIFTDIFNYW